MQNRRWYDQEPSCSRLLDQIRAMPQAEAREFCAQVAIRFAETLRKELRQKGKTKLAVRSMGISGISGLYQFGHKKRRGYDGDPLLHKMAGALYTLPREGLGIFGFKLGDSVGMIGVYATVCSMLDQTPNAKDMARICNVTLHAGKSEARNILINMVGKDLYESLDPENASP